MQVAILDDDAYPRRLLTMLVETGGHQAFGFAQGEALLAALDGRSFDVLLLDWMMPGMSGEQVLAALRQGADDDLVRAPKGMELLARMEALTRRARLARATALRVGRFEFDLAVHFFRNPGRLLSRTSLLEQVWGISAQLDTRTVDTHVSRVRRKLGLDAAAGWKLLPVYGFGYRLEQVGPD
jgi:two-component system response regulator RegX3